MSMLDQGPDDWVHDYIEECGALLRSGLADARTVALPFEPGNGTRYELILTPTGIIHELVASRKQPWPVLEGREHQVIVTLLNYGSSYPIALLDRGLIAASYLMEKLRCTEGDAEVLQDLFAAIGRAA